MNSSFSVHGNKTIVTLGYFIKIKKLNKTTIFYTFVKCKFTVYEVYGKFTTLSPLKANTVNPLVGCTFALNRLRSTTYIYGQRLWNPKRDT